MIRKLANINELQYVVDFYDAYIDMYSETHYEQFIMLRKYNLVNNVAEDTDIYLINRSLWDDYCDEKVDLVWPASDTLNIEYSLNYEIFNDKFITESFIEFDDNDNKISNIGSDVYELLDKDGNPASIRCNKIRIYRPMNKKSVDSIIHISNLINNIKFHYICRFNSDYAIHSYEQFKLNNTIYSEYIEIFFPSIPELFSENSKIYFKEDLNLVYSSKNEDYMETITYEIDEIHQLVPFNLFIQPYRLIEENGEIVKLYLKLTKSLENNCFTFPINVLLYPYDNIAGYNNFIPNENYLFNSCTFMSKYEIKLCARLDFMNNYISIIGEFIFPSMNNFKDDENGSAVKKAYCYFNNVKESMYNNFSQKQRDLLFNDIDSLDISSMTAHDKHEVDIKYNLRKKLTDNEYFEMYKKMKKDSIMEEYRESQDADIDFIGFRLMVATDLAMKNKIYELNDVINIKNLDNFAIDITRIYDSWKQLNTSVVAQIVFIDRFLGIQLFSNVVYLTNEGIKYTFLDDRIGRLNKLANINEQYNEKIQDSIINMKDINLNEDGINKINFFNNITCVINNTTPVEQQNSLPTNVKILYKPIFYRTSDLQNVKIRRNVTQKIGINLGNYMTKVESFKLVIGNNNIIEYGRNDVYVLFEIKAGTISQNPGTYDIYNQDNEYLATGSYQLY